MQVIASSRKTERSEIDTFADSYERQTTKNNPRFSLGFTSENLHFSSDSEKKSMTLQDHLIESLILAAQNLSGEERIAIAKKISENLLGVRIEIRADPVENLEEALNPKISFVEISKMERRIQGVNKLNDDELESVILLSLEENGPMGITPIMKKINLNNFNRVKAVLESLLACGFITHNGRKGRYSKFALALKKK